MADLLILPNETKQITWTDLFNKLLKENKEPLKDFIYELLDERETQKQPIVKPKYIGVSEVCKLTGLKRPTIYLLTSKKKIPFIKPEGTKKIVFEYDVIVEWVKNRNA